MLSWGFHIHCSSGCQEPKNPSILSSHSQRTKEKEQTNKTANFKCNSGSQQQLTPHNPMNELVTIVHSLKNFTTQNYHDVRAQTPKTKTSILVDKKWHTRVSSTQTESFQNKLIINGWQERLLASSGNFLALTCTKTRSKRDKPEMVMQQQPKLGGINNNNNTTQSTKTNIQKQGTNGKQFIHKK